MAGFVFGIILLIAGICGAIWAVAYKGDEEYVKDANGKYCYDGNGERLVRYEYPMKRWSILIAAGGLVLCIIFTLFGCFASVDTGHTGIITVFGRVEDRTLDAGITFKAPWEKVIQMNNKVQKSEETLACFSSDIQEVSCKYVVNYQIDKQNAQVLYKTVGLDYYSTAIAPTVAESVKAVMANYTAEQLIGSRSALAEAIEVMLRDQLASYNIEVVSTAIEDLDFTDSFTNAVEAKQVAAQNKLKAVIEQEQAVLQAKADADVAKTKAEADADVAKTKAKADAEIAQIQAQADMEVQKIGADAAAYAGQKEGSVAMQRLGAINGWTVVVNEESGINELRKPDGEVVQSDELLIGVERLMEYYYTQAWNGQMPQTVLGDGTNTFFGIN